MNIMFNILPIAALLTSMAMHLQAMESTEKKNDEVNLHPTPLMVSRAFDVEEKKNHENGGFSQNGLKATKHIVDIIHDKQLKSEEKIKHIKEAMTWGIDDLKAYEGNFEMPILAHAIEAGDLAVVKFLVEECGADINAQFIGKTPYYYEKTETTSLLNTRFSHKGDVLQKQPTKKMAILELAAQHSFFPQNDQIAIYQYLLTHNNTNLSEELTHTCMSLTNQEIDWLLKKKPNSIAKLIILNHCCINQLALTCLGTPTDWLEAAIDLVELFGIIHTQKRIYDLLSIALHRAEWNNIPLPKELLITLLQEIVDVPQFRSKEAAELIGHKIFAAVKNDLPLSKENCDVAIFAAYNNDFSFAIPLMHKTCPQSLLPMKEIIALVECAIKKKNYTLLTAIIENIKLPQQDLIALHETANKNNDHVAYALLKQIYTLPRSMMSIITASHSRPHIHNPTETEKGLLDYIMEMKHNERGKSLKTLLKNYRYGAQHLLPVRFCYGASLHILQSQIWNLSPSGKQQDGSMNNNRSIIGTDCARTILSFVGPEWHKRTMQKK